MNDVTVQVTVIEITVYVIGDPYVGVKVALSVQVPIWLAAVGDKVIV